MSFSVVASVNHLVAEYRRFLLSVYRLADPRLREQFESHIHLQSQGWLVLTVWGQTILRNPERCEEQIWRSRTTGLLPLDLP